MRHRLRARRPLPRLAPHRGDSEQGRVGLCVLRIEPRTGGSVYTTYLIDDVTGDGPTSVATAGALDDALERIRTFAETLGAADQPER